MADEKWYASTNEEHYNSDAYGSRAEAVANFPEDAGLEPGDGFWVGRSEPVHVRTPPAYVLLDWMGEGMMDQVPGDVVDSWPEASLAARADLEAETRMMVLGWLERHKLTPSFFAVVDVTHHIAGQQEDDPNGQ